MDADKYEKIQRQIEFAEDWLHGVNYWVQHFSKTSEHPSWQGKVRCKYCKASGWPSRDGLDPNWNLSTSQHLWWGKKHGANCKFKVVWDAKQKPFYSTTGTYGSNSTISSYTWSQAFCMQVQSPSQYITISGV